MPNYQAKLYMYAALIKAITGESAYLYTSKPGDGQTRVVFQDRLELSYKAGAAYAQELYEAARSEWRKENWPLDRESTDYVSTWLVNDALYYSQAKDLAEESLAELAEYVTASLNDAIKDSAAWHTRRQLSERDLECIDWCEIAECLLTE